VPAYVFIVHPWSCPSWARGIGYWVLAHTHQEYYVVDGCQGRHAQVHGIREVEKSNVGFLHHFAAY